MGKSLEVVLKNQNSFLDISWIKIKQRINSKTVEIFVQKK